MAIEPSAWPDREANAPLNEPTGVRAALAEPERSVEKGGDDPAKTKE